jgi:hypothetical protein
MRSTVLSLCFCLGLLSSLAQSHSRSDPMTAGSRNHQQSFFEWAFKPGNSQGSDYGRRIEDARQALVGHLANGDFWGQVIPWCWVAVMFVKLKHQQKVREQRLTIAARLLARIYNACVEARRQALEAIRLHNELVDSLNGPPDVNRPSELLAATAASKALPQSASATATAEESPARTDAKTTPPFGSRRLVPRSQNDKKPAPERPLTSVDYVAQINTLQERLTISHETNKNRQNEIDRLQREVDRHKTNNSNSKDKDHYTQ